MTRNGKGIYVGVGVSVVEEDKMIKLEWMKDHEGERVRERAEQYIRERERERVCSMGKSKWKEEEKEFDMIWIWKIMILILWMLDESKRQVCMWME